MISRLILLAMFAVLASSIKPIEPQLGPSKDTEFATNMPAVSAMARKLKLDDMRSRKTVKIGILKQISANGHWDIQKGYDDITKENQKGVDAQKNDVIAGLKARDHTITKRSGPFPMDLGDKKLVFFVSEIFDPTEE